METPTWEQAHGPLVLRICGALGIAFVALGFVTLGGPYFDNVSTPQVLSWVQHHLVAINVSGFAQGLSASVMAVFILGLVACAGRGLLATIATAATAAFLGIDWVQAGAYFGLADAGGRSQADAGIVALFSLVKTLTFADGFAAGMAVTALCLLALRSRILPVPLVWLGLVMGVFHLVELPIQLAISQSPGGITGPIGVVMALVWVLAVSVTLLIRPVWNPGRVAIPAAA